MKLAIVIPTFNKAKYLQKTLESIQKQTVNVEVIVIDDGSTDNTKDLVKKFKFAKYFFQENKGVAGARNRGLKETKAELICFMCDDKILPKDYAEKMIKNSRTASVIKPRLIAVGKSFSNKALQHLYDYQLKCAIGNSKKLTKSRTTVPVLGGSTLRRDVYIPFNEDLTTGEDTELALQLEKKGITTYFDPSIKVKVHFRDSLLSNMRRYYQYGKDWSTIAKRNQINKPIPKNLRELFREFKNLVIYAKETSAVGITLVYLCLILFASATGSYMNHQCSS